METARGGRKLVLPRRIVFVFQPGLVATKSVVQSAHQKSFIKDRKECTDLVSKYYTSLGTFATPHGFIQEAQRRYTDFSAIKKTLLGHTAYGGLRSECTEEMRKDESLVMFNVFANLYPHRFLQDDTQTRALSETLLQGCKIYSEHTTGPTAKSQATMLCERLERERINAIMGRAYSMMKAIGVEGSKRTH